jgi:hypothetical protein
MTSAEARAVTVVAFPATVVVFAYLLDRGGLPIRPWPMLLVVLLAVGATWRLVRPQSGISRRDDEGILGVVVSAMAVWLLWLARPSFLPLATGPDLTHHLILIDYIERHWQLVHDPSVEQLLGEMAQYTPGSHVLAALAGAWSGSDGLRALHPVLAVSVALQAGFLWLIARRLLPAGAPRQIALVAVILLLASPTYFLRSFTEFGFVAQVVAGLFAIVMWWAAVAWDQQPDWRVCGVFTLAAAAAFLTWPVYSGAPTLAMGLVIALHGGLPWRVRLRHFSIAMMPFGIVAVAYLAGRLGWLQMAGTGGLAARPSVPAFSWPLLLLSSSGFLVCVLRRRARATVLFTLAVLAEAAAFYVIALRADAPQPYMALKMIYLVLWPMTALAAAALGEAWVALADFRRSRAVRREPCQQGTSTGEATIAWAVVVVAFAVAARPLLASPRRLHPLPPAVSLPLYDAGRWARANLPAGCIDYLVGDDETAYWLHLAVLGNPRMSPRTGDNATYEPKDAIVRWLTPGGLQYAIADLPELPRTVRDELDIVQQFGTAAVVRRRGTASCPAP